MEILTERLVSFKCDQCNNYLSCGPVYVCHDGRGTCGRCPVPEASAIRNKNYEAAAKLLKFPCMYEEHGCPVKLYFSENGQSEHEQVCDFRQYDCLIVEPGTCDWTGQRSQLLEHCRSAHAEKIVDNPCVIKHDLQRSGQKNYLVPTFEDLFLLHTKVCLSSGKIFHAVRYLGNPEKAVIYDYTLNITKVKQAFSKSGKIAPEGCLSDQENTPLVLKINSVLDMIDEFDGTCSVAIEKHDEYVEKVSVSPKCSNVVSKCVPCGTNDWFCENCAPVKISCREKCKGCTYRDVRSRVYYHQIYFCDYSSSNCCICNFITENTLTEHYKNTHYRTRYYEKFKSLHHLARYVILSTQTDVIVVHFSFTKRWFEMRVCTSIPNDQLYRHKCIVILFPEVEQVVTFVAKKEDEEDWKIRERHNLFDTDRPCSVSIFFQ